jgi:hypothetical protein
LILVAIEGPSPKGGKEGDVSELKKLLLTIQRTKEKNFNPTTTKKKQKHSSLYFPVSIMLAGFFVISK